MPSNLGDCSLDGVRILKNHDSLGGDGLGHEFGILASEVLLEQIDLVVLLNAVGGALDKFTSGLAEAHQGVFGQFSHVLVDLVDLRVVVLLGPTADAVVHTVVLGGHALSVDLQKSNSCGMIVTRRRLLDCRNSKSVTYTVLRHLRDVVKDGLVGVARCVVSVLALVVSVGTHNSGVRVLELGGAAELGSSLRVLVLFSHC